MAKFRKKPVVIEATRWFPGFQVEGVEIRDERYEDGSCHTSAYISTLEGVMHVNPGDWIITGVMGEKYCCRNDIFEKTYDSLSAHDVEKYLDD